MEPPLTLESLKEVDGACDRFESAWRRGVLPRIEDHLECATGLRPVLLRSLVRLECELRGIDPAFHAASLRARFPHDGDVLDSLLAEFDSEMRVNLTVTDGPASGTSFTFDQRDVFLVGRGRGTHFQPDKNDRYFSRFHFLVDINPPMCRLMDLGSRNGTQVNGTKVGSSELKDGDRIRAGRTELAVRVELERMPQTFDWGDPAAEDWSAPGYRILEELGRGGMGVVYRAIREADGSEVALKAITPQGSATRRNIDRFLREASILMRLEHPNIVRFRDLGSAGRKLFFTMDYVPGTDAQRLLTERGKWSLRSAVRMISEVLIGLAYAHEAGFVHRDIKPANILLGRGQTGYSVKLADFGLARVYEASQISGLSNEGDFGGTLRFMPPEQMTDYRNVTPASDQFSAAATLYHLLTGQFIHELDGRGRVPVVSVLDGQAVPIRDRRPELPVEFANALHRALERDPKDRFESVSEFAIALESFSR